MKVGRKVEDLARIGIVQLKLVMMTPQSLFEKFTSHKSWTMKIVMQVKDLTL